MTTEDPRRFAPAAARNRGPIRDLLQLHLPKTGLVLEIASGTGEHVTFFAAASDPALIFQPSDPDPTARSSIDAWTNTLSLTNVRPALAIDAAEPVWPVAAADAVLSINMIHISPWRATEGLMRGAARILSDGGLLYLYGPYRQDGRHTAVSNESFDAGLREADPEWGVRDLETVVALATENGFATPAVIAMPANNLSVIFRRRT